MLRPLRLVIGWPWYPLLGYVLYLLMSPLHCLCFMGFLVRGLLLMHHIPVKLIDIWSVSDGTADVVDVVYVNM
jgi:hypothetical protein